MRDASQKGVDDDCGGPGAMISGPGVPDAVDEAEAETDADVDPDSATLEGATDDDGATDDEGELGGVFEGVAPVERDDVCDAVCVAAAVAVPEELPVTDGVVEGVAPVESDVVGDAVCVTAAETDAEDVAVAGALGDAETLLVLDGAAPFDGVCVRALDEESVVDPEAVGDPVFDLEAVPVALAAGSTTGAAADRTTIGDPLAAMADVAGETPVASGVVSACSELMSVSPLDASAMDTVSVSRMRPIPSSGAVVKTGTPG